MAKGTRRFVPVQSELPPKWAPQPGDVLEGEYIGERRIPKRGGGSFLTFQIKDEETGEVCSIAGKIVERQMQRLQIGTFVQITYEGMVPAAKGNAKKFTVAAEAGAKIAPEVFDEPELEADDDDEYPEERGVYRGGRIERDDRSRRTARDATR
jgi:hypothetical protein